MIEDAMETQSLIFFYKKTTHHLGIFGIIWLKFSEISLNWQNMTNKGKFEKVVSKVALLLNWHNYKG